MPNHEVISAFLDNEPFDAHTLATSLAEPGGRELLLDLIALRAVVQEEAVVATPTIDTRVIRRQRRLWIATGFAAATIIFAMAGLVSWKKPRPAPSSISQEADLPPRPDRVVTFEPGVEWHDVNR